MITYIIVDDEPLAHEVIEAYCEMLPHMQLKQNCYNAMEAMQYLNQATVDILFLDLKMPKLKGFEFLRTLLNPPKVIVTSAYKEYALEGYELNIVDYLVKPFGFERFVKAVNKAMENNRVGEPAQSPESSEHRFFVKGNKKYHQVNADSILYVEAYGNYTKLVLPEETIISHEKISHYEHSLPANEFLRVHKSFIVALKKINHIEGNRIFIADHEIPIGQTYRSTVNKLVGG